MMTWREWVWPMPALLPGSDGKPRLPIVSSPFGRGVRGTNDEPRDHLGVDICYKRPVAGAVRLPELSKWFECESGTPVVSAGPGLVWYARWQATGYTVLVYHEESPVGPIQTYHTHLSSLSVEAKQRVQSGQVIGVVGYSPSKPPDNINHDHFEIRVMSLGGSRDMRVIDPQPLMRARWGYVTWHRVNGFVGHIDGANLPWSLHMRDDNAGGMLGAGHDVLLG